MPEDAKVLDFGTEMGLQAVAIASMPGGERYTVVGTDIGVAEMEVARMYAHEAGVDDRITFFVDDILCGAESQYVANKAWVDRIERAHALLGQSYEMSDKYSALKPPPLCRDNVLAFGHLLIQHIQPYERHI